MHEVIAKCSRYLSLCVSATTGLNDHKGFNEYYNRHDIAGDMWYYGKSMIVEWNAN